MTNSIIILSVFFLLNVYAQGQLFFSEEERLQGYKIAGEVGYFVFDEEVYQIRPDQVVVEGTFRNWNHDLNDRKWWLKRQNDDSHLWLLKINSGLPFGNEFKFRTARGFWFDPPATAPNRRGQNLIFAPETELIELRAEIVTPRHIRLIYSGSGLEISDDPESYRLSNAEGIELPVHKILYVRPGERHLFPGVDLNIMHLFTVQDKRNGLKSIAYFDGWFRHLYSEERLGAFYDKERNKTIFRLFAPRATMVNLYLYDNPEKRSGKKYSLVNKMSGVWEKLLNGNHEGMYYDYTIHGPDEPGNYFFEKNPVHITDPYGQVSVDSWGPCRIWPPVEAPRPVKGGRPPMEDVIAYEVHVQDFTRQLPVPEKQKGTFTAFFKRGLRNSNGEKIGFDHIIDLGINVVHLQPVQEFMHFPTDAWQAAFINDTYMIEQGINMENYQWGYRTSHALAIESRFREKGSEWGAQNKQFRDLIEAFHDNGIAVIVDVVFNHTAERMDGRMDYFNFTVIDKQYYYRTDAKLDFFGEYGTEVKSEERPMVQRWILDQCKNLVEQYGVDGFRIDLAGQTDEQTLRELRRELGPDIIIYGEPWIASADPRYENNPDWDWYKKDAPITFFQDEARNAFKGSPDNPQDKWRDRGYAGGNGQRDEVKKALSAGFEEDDTPIDGINYLDIHDNWALADRFAISNWDGRQGVDERRVKIAATLLFTSLGPVVIHGGTEFLRSKGHAPLKEIVKKFQSGQLYFHGKRDTYNLVKANEFLWENKGKSIGEDNGQIKCNYKSMYAFWKGLIALRKSDLGKIFRLAKKPPENYYQWIEPENPRLLGYILADKILVMINADSTAGVFRNLPITSESDWQLIGTINEIDHEFGIKGHQLSKLSTQVGREVELEKESILIWRRN